MLRILFCTFALLLGSAANAGSDIWSALYKETLQKARQGDSEAQYNVGAMYQNGRGVTASRDKAIEWYGKAAEQGNSKAVSRLGLMKANQASFESELQQAEQGSAGSQYNIGNMYTKGNGTNMDVTQAVIWYEKAASQGHIKAAYKLGLANYEGSGVRKNGKQARKWFGIAADNGYAPAQYYLGKIYAGGYGVRRDYSEALNWFTRAVDGGFDQARGEMIDVTERMKMNTARKKQARQEDRPVQREEKPAKQQAAGQVPQDDRPAKKAQKKKQQQTAAADNPATAGGDPAGGSSIALTMESLMLGNWNREEKPVAWLPSSINNCRTENEKIICFSDDQVRESGMNSIKFKTKAIISQFSKAGDFTVSYRNLVINAVTNKQTDSDAVSAFDEAADEKGYAVKTGWGKDHRMECQFSDSTAVKCTKNKTHAMLITSMQQVADRK
jgi:hypothetical protein